MNNPGKTAGLRALRESSLMVFKLLEWNEMGPEGDGENPRVERSGPRGKRATSAGALEGATGCMHQFPASRSGAGAPEARHIARVSGLARRDIRPAVYRDYSQNVHHKGTDSTKVAQRAGLKLEV
jgi:hypothetical protein